MREIAIVGIGCHLPGGVRSPADLWTLLLNQGDGMVDIPPERWSQERFYDPDPEVPGRLYTRRGGFLQASLEAFDPGFFGISPREAAIMDPQQRLLLEVTQEALDDAGHAGRPPDQKLGRCVDDGGDPRPAEPGDDTSGQAPGCHQTGDRHGQHSGWNDPRNDTIGCANHPLRSSDDAGRCLYDPYTDTIHPEPDPAEDGQCRRSYGRPCGRER